MNNADLRKLSVEELQQKLEDGLDELANLRIQKATHQLSNPSKIRLVRRDVARIKTLLHEEKMGLSKG